MDENVVAKISANDGVNFRESHPRHLVHEVAELVDVDVGEQIGPRRQKLVQLDV